MRIDTPFLNYLCEAENAPLFYERDNKYTIHESPEGGNDTIGYGHKLSLLEDASRQVYGFDVDTLTEVECVVILSRDVERCVEALQKLFPQQWSGLGQRRQEMLCDFQFNLRGGVNAFPKFTAGVITGDIVLQREEYERKYKHPKTHRYLPLEERNRLFYNRYLSDEALAAWI
jgi:hypothetical protein